MSSSVCKCSYRRSIGTYILTCKGFRCRRRRAPVAKTQGSVRGRMVIRLLPTDFKFACSFLKKILRTRLSMSVALLNTTLRRKTAVDNLAAAELNKICLTRTFGNRALALGQATPTHRSFDFALNVSPPRRVPTAEYLRLGLVWR